MASGSTYFLDVWDTAILVVGPDLIEVVLPDADPEGVLEGGACGYVFIGMSLPSMDTSSKGIVHDPSGRESDSSQCRDPLVYRRSGFLWCVRPSSTASTHPKLTLPLVKLRLRHDSSIEERYDSGGRYSP